MYKKSLELFDKNFEAYMNLGDIYLYEKQDKREALYNYRKALELNPDSKAAAQMLEEVLKQMSR